jgi:predicted Rossmann-fold nucleotide-binding protein
MDARADAFLALPGGLGTLEELLEVWVARSLGMHAKPGGRARPRRPVRAAARAGRPAASSAASSHRPRRRAAWAADVARRSTLSRRGCATRRGGRPLAEEVLEAEP